MTDDAYQAWAHPSPFHDAIGGFKCHATIRSGSASWSKAASSTVAASSTPAPSLPSSMPPSDIPSARRWDPSARLVTVNLSCDLLGSARRDEWVDVDVDVTSAGG